MKMEIAFPDRWTCSICTYENRCHSGICEMCQHGSSTKSSVNTKMEKKMQIHGCDTWMCSICTYKNRCDSATCQMCQHGSSTKSSEKKMQIPKVISVTDTLPKIPVSKHV